MGLRTDKRYETPMVEVTEERKEEWEKFRGCSPMQQALSSLGLTPIKAAKCLAEELEATETKATVVEREELITRPDGSMGVIKSKDWSYSAPLADNGTRQRARQDLMKLWGSFPEKESEGRGSEEEPLIIHIKE